MKRKPLLLFLLLALLAPWSAKAQQQYVNIGDPQSPFSTGLFPVATGWYYSLSQQIYTSDEIGMAGYISSIAFDYIVNESFSMEGVQVYMKNVSKSYFESNTDMVSLDGATKVFEGTFTVQGPGWVTIQLDTPFFYDGTSNLLLCCYDPTEGLIQWDSELWFRTTETNSNRSICYYSHEYCPDINNLSNYQGYYANGDYNTSNIQLGIFPYIYIQDQLVEDICLENWDTNPQDGNLSYAEAAAVTSLGQKFKETGISHLDILEYFTGLATLNRYEFQNCNYLEDIYIPRSVSLIEPSIFQGCSRLQYITVDPSNTTCTSLNGDNGIFEILDGGYKLVAGCKSTIIPEGVTVIAEGALESLPMSTLTLPSTLQTIESYGIHLIDGLESLTINAVTPPTITEYFLYGTPRTIPVIVPVESLAAYYNYNNTGQPWGGFTNIIADGNISFVDPAVKAICVTQWDSNGDGELSYAEAAAVTTLNPSGIWDNSVFKGNTTITSFDELQYFNGLTSTSGCVFEGCEHLTSITLPPNLERIGSSAFRHCHNLSSVDIPNSVTFISSRAFEDCVHLTSITLPPNLERIESEAFNLCYNLSSVNIPNGVTFIGSLAFSYCQLTSIEIPNSVTQIGSLVFRGCPLSSVNIPASVRIIDFNPFYGCEPLASITVDAGNPEYSSPNGCNAIIKTDEHRLISGCKNTVIPNDVTEINDHAFSDCTGLSSIEIPASVETINDYAFKGCSNLEEITVLAETPPSISINSVNCFNGVPTTIPVHVPCNTKTAYQQASGWSVFTNYIDPCANIDFAHEAVKAICVANWDTNQDGELSYAEAAAVQSLGEAFKNNEDITSFNELQYFTGLTSINDEAFSSCRSLTAVTLPPSVLTIGNVAFSGCTGLTSITVEAITPPTLGEGAFDNVPVSIPVYVHCGSLEAYQNYNNTGTPWGGFTNIHDLCENPLCVAPTNVEVTSTEPQNGYNGFTFSFTPGHEEQALWSFYVSEDYELPATYQEMVANGWLGSTNQTVGSYYPTDEDELAMEGTTYYLWVGYNCGTEGDPDIVWSEGPATVTIPSEIVYNLTSGVNWWTPLAQITLGELKSQLYGIPVVINSQNEGFLYSEDDWSGTLSKSDDYIIQPGEMYKIVIKDDSSRDIYVFAVPQPWAEVELQPGYNWFGYTGNTKPIANAISPNSPPTNYDKIIDENGHEATYQDGSWTGDLTHLYKGRGYVYYSAADYTKSLYLE